MKKEHFLDPQTNKLRFLGNKGTLIPVHRSLRRLEFKPSIMLTVLLLPIAFNLLLWLGMDSILHFWHSVYDFWINALQLNGQTSVQDFDLFWHNFELPYADLPTWLPTHSMVGWNFIICIIFYLISFFLPQTLMPINYLFRAALLIQISASVYFWFNPDRDPYVLPSYYYGMFTVGCYFLFLITPLLAMIYYIFDFPLWQKVLITVGVLGYFIVFMPFQYLLHGMIISHWSCLFTPVLYLLFGPLLNVFLFICWYSFAMTWTKSENRLPDYR